MTESEEKRPKVAIVGGGRGAGRTLKTYIDLLEELETYRAIGTVEELKALKEKNEPKKMLHNGVNWYRCPNGCEIHKKQFEKDWYCPKCGQKLDWKLEQKESEDER